MTQHVVLAIVAAGAISAQMPPSSPRKPPSGAVAATVTDSSGAAVPGVAIWATLAPDLKFSCSTRAHGECTIGSLGAGRYLLETQLSGFVTERTTIDLTEDQTYQWHVTLKVWPMSGATFETLIARVTELTGPDAIDCGRNNPSRPLVEAPMERIRPALACALQSSRARKPFWTSIQYPGIDSEVVQGLLGNAAGEVYRFDFDSQPCGNPGCAARFVTTHCDHPVLVQQSEMVKFVCSESGAGAG